MDYRKDIERLKSLLSYGILDTPKEPFYNDLAELAAIICEVPIAMISFLDDKRQWYKSKVGMDAEELPIEETICQYTLIEDDLLEITDTTKDERLTNNPHVHSEGGIHFYAGISLKTIEGHAIGTVCVADHKPSMLSDRQKQAIRIISRIVMVNLESRKKNEGLSVELERILQEKIDSAQRKLALQEKAYNKLLTAISKSNAVAEFDPRGYVLTANEQFSELMGFDIDELTGLHHEVFLTEDDKALNSRFWAALRAGESQSGRFQRITKDKKSVWIQASYSPVISANGNIERITKIAQDITNEITYRQGLEGLAKQKDNFIANVSHELRTPINAIVGFTEVLLEKEYEANKVKMIHTIKTAADSLLYLVNGILDLSKMEVGLFQFDKEAFRLHPLIEGIYSMLNVKASRKSLKFLYTIDSDVPHELIGDKNRISQVLVNLLDNAIKFTEKGEVRLSVSQQQINNEETLLILKISDTGIGIESEKLDQVFERFRQADADTARKFGGTGLGLNISKMIVEKQGGEITVNSTPNQGTTFTIKLPFIISKTTVNGSQDRTMDKGWETKLPKARVLLCEDNEMNQFLVQTLMKPTSIELIIANNGLEGVQKVKENQFDLVLMDIQMPEMDGFQATKVIRDELQSDVPIVALTAHSMVTEKTRCIKMGMNDYLSKPFKKEDLYEKMYTWISSKSIEKKFNDVPIDLDFSHLEDFCEGNKEIEADMIGIFLKQSEETIVEMEEMMNKSDWSSLKKEAHRLKSSFGLIGANTTYLKSIENYHGDIDFQDIFSKLKYQIAEINKQLRIKIA